MLSDQWNPHGDYKMALGCDKGWFDAFVNSSDAESGDVYFNDKELIRGEQGTDLFCLPAGYEDINFISGSNWVCYKFEAEADMINVKIGETSDENVYAKIQFTESLKIDDNLDKNIESMIQEGKVKNNITILNNVNDLGSVERIIGKKYDLTQASFLQDILAQKISNMYGLNLKNKDLDFIHLDPYYLIYRGFDAEGRTIEITFNYYPESSKYEYLDTSYESFDKKFEEDSRYSYTDSEGNVYDYFWDIDTPHT